MNELDKLKNCKNRSEFISLLGYRNIQKITCIVYKLSDDEKYKKFKINKKDGSKREIKSPQASLKHIQKRLSKLLEKCYFEIEKNSNSSICFFNAHGFLSKKSILTNADKHKNKRYVLNIDLSDFFPSINFGRVYGFFNKNKYFQLENNISSTIAQIACFENELPQGASTSPIISNLITMNLDKSLSVLANRYKLTYTRYADDITFSTNLREFPKDIAYLDENLNWHLGNTLRTIIEKNYFKINDKKTRMQYKTSRQEVTGIIVNKKLNVDRRYIKNTKSAIYQFLKYNNEIESKDETEQKDKIVLSPRNNIIGRISFIYQVRNYIQSKKSNEKKESSKKDISEKLYTDFFYIDNCIHNEKITILAEGKTDKTYIDTAFSHFKSEYNLDFNIIKHSNIFLNIMRIYGDIQLKDFAFDYKKNIENYKSETYKNPVIILFDRDNKSILTINFYNKGNIKDNPFVFVEPNLYICSLPKTDNKFNGKKIDMFSIEFYFQENILKTDMQLKNGEIKILEILEKKSNDEVYTIGEDGLSKVKFANSIIKSYKCSEEKTKEINEKNKQVFLEFRKLFELITEIKNDYNSKK